MWQDSVCEQDECVQECGKTRSAAQHRGEREAPGCRGEGGVAETLCKESESEYAREKEEESNYCFEGVCETDRSSSAEIYMRVMPL